MLPNFDTLVVTVAIVGTGAYMAYMIEKRRADIRKTIQVIELEDTEFWEGLSRLRPVAAKA
jgi:hypothetical protein